MDEGYPFSGTGNLYNFTRGLISIAVQNNIIILYDNDAEGVSSYNKTAKLNIPGTMRVLKLPDLPAFEQFNTIGPGGALQANINGSGAAIECYLDLGPTPAVRWNSFNKDLQVYQGVLENKESYARTFYALKSADSGYDFSKIEVVLDLIFSTCVAMKESLLFDSLEAETGYYAEDPDEAEKAVAEPPASTPAAQTDDSGTVTPVALTLNRV